MLGLSGCVLLLCLFGGQGTHIKGITETTSLAIFAQVTKYDDLYFFSYRGCFKQGIFPLNVFHQDFNFYLSNSFFEIYYGLFDVAAEGLFPLTLGEDTLKIHVPYSAAVFGIESVLSGTGSQ